MGRSARYVLIAIGAVLALVVVRAICLPLFLNADSFRTRIESTLTKSLGRKVTIGKLNLSVWTGGLEDLSVDDAQIKDASVTLATAGQAAVYQQLNAQIMNVTPKTSSPFSVSAQLPGGGSLSANGKVGPFNQRNNAATPVDAQVTLKHVDLATAGVLPPDAGIGGMAICRRRCSRTGRP